MARPLARQWEVMRAVSLVTYKEWAAYRTHSLVSVFVGPVYFVVQYFIWTAVYGGTGSSSRRWSATSARRRSSAT
jgi:ABC-2 type transport system permease protein